MLQGHYQFSMYLPTKVFCFTACAAAVCGSDDKSGAHTQMPGSVQQLNTNKHRMHCSDCRSDDGLGFRVNSTSKFKVKIALVVMLFLGRLRVLLECLSSSCFGLFQFSKI